MNPYEVLGVGKNASEDDLKRALRRKAKSCHPDLHPGDDTAVERYKELQLAFDVLSNPVRRAKYDATGEIDSLAPDNTMSPIIGYLSELVDHCLSTITQGGISIDEYNILNLIRKEVKRRIDKLNESIEDYPDVKAKLEKIALRFKTKDGKNNYLRSLFEAKINGMEETVARFKAELECLAKIKEITDDSTYDYNQYAATATVKFNFQMLGVGK